LASETDEEINNLDRRYFSFLLEGNYPKAVEISDILLLKISKQYGELHPAYASCLNNKAEALRKLCSYQGAEKLFLKAVGIVRLVQGEQHPSYTKILGNLAKLYKDKGDFSKSEPLFNQLLPKERIIAAENKSDPESQINLAKVINDVAGLYYTMGRLTQAESLYVEAQNICLKFDRKDNFFGSILNNLAAVYDEKGDLLRAEKYYLQAIETRKKILGEYHPAVAESLNNLGLLYLLKGDYAKAKEHVNQSIKIYELSGEYHANYASCLNSLAMIYDQVGDYVKAQGLYLQAHSICRQKLGPTHHIIANSANNLAESYRKTGQHSIAEKLLLEALDVCKNSLGENHPTYARILNNLIVHYNTDDLEKTENMLKNILDTKVNNLGLKHPDLAVSLVNLAAIRQKRGNLSGAQSLLLRSISICKSSLGVNHANFVLALHNLTQVYILSQSYDKALNCMISAGKSEDKLIGEIFSMSSERQRMIYLSRVRKDLQFFLSIVVAYFHSSPRAIQSAYDAVLHRKFIAGEALSAQHRQISEKYEHLESKLKNLSGLRMQIAIRTFSGGDYKPNTNDAPIHFLKERAESLESELAAAIPEMKLEDQMNKANWQQVAKCLSVDSVLIEFVKFRIYNVESMKNNDSSGWGPERYLVFVVVGGTTEVQMKDLGEAGDIDKLIHSFKMAIEHEAKSYKLDPDASISPISFYSGSELRQLIFDPLLKFIGKKTKLFIATDGEINSLPFEILPLDPQKRFIDEYSTTYLTTGRELLNIKTPSLSSPTGIDVVIADPDFDLTSSEEPASKPGYFKRLSGTRVEGESIASMLGVQPLLGSDALESRLRSLKSPRILHIATHGFFPIDNGLESAVGSGDQTPPRIFWEQRIDNPLLRSGVTLAGVNSWIFSLPVPEEAEDGIFTAEDILSLDLSNTDLVVLSACGSGLGEIQAGEGVMGLRRSLVISGAKSVVMSLWRVPDEETRELMEEFYRNLLSGLPKAECLRKAQLKIKEKKSLPYYWGGFIIQGDSGPLVPKK
jgi:CHAT domain-containing protein